MKRSDAILTAAGLGLFAFVASRIGWAGLLHQLMTASLAIPVLVSVSFLRLLLQTQAWRIALRQEGMKTSFGELLGIRLASQSMGYLSVLGPALSEPMKIKLLGNNWKQSTTATVVDSGVYWFSSALIGIVGCVAAAVVLAHGTYSKTLFGIASIFVIGAALLLRK